MDKELLALLNQEIGKTKLSISQLSEILGIDRSIFNKFINGQRVPNIEDIVKILHYFFPNHLDSYELLKRLIPSFKSLQSFKVMLEFATLQRDNETILNVAEMLRMTSSTKHKEWADFFILWLDYRLGRIDNDTYLHSLLTTTLQSDELKAIRNIRLMHYYYTTLSRFDLAGQYGVKAKEDLDALPDSLIKNSYLSKYYLYRGHITLLSNYELIDTCIDDFKKSMEYAVSPLVIAINLYNLGVTFQYHDHQKAIEYFRQAESIFRKCSTYDASLVYIADFILDPMIPRSRLIGNDLDGIREVDLKHTQVKVLYHIKTNNIAKAKEILDNLKEDEFNDEILLMCLGTIEKSIPILMKSLLKCIELNQINEAYLAIKELMALGFDPSMVDLILRVRENYPHPVYT
ncbi:MAG TPA: AimR family lysis-lysogeny pheromone receptor [Pseudoneobacillus sp.]|nr:AimR family lysis-lysogeny pheromone receptor [Pseudoneobacillus sp.]